jgi:O-antigen/teichoic acid export membrane protein
MINIVFLNVKSFLFENKGLKQTIFKNVFWLTVSQLFTRICSLLVIILPARHYGPEIYGKFGFAFSFVAFFSIFLDFGLSNLMIRGVSRDKSRSIEYIDNIIFLKMILSFLVSLIVIFLIYFVKNDVETINIVYFLLAYIVISSFAGFFQSVFAANEKMQYMTLCGFIGDIVLLFFVYFFIISKFSIVSLSQAYFFSALLELVLTLMIIWRLFSRFLLKINTKTCLKIAKEALPFGLGAFFTAIYLYFNIIVLGIIYSSEHVGWYSIAFRTAFFITAISGIIFTSFFPAISRFFKEDIQKFKDSYFKYAFIMYAQAIPVAFGGVVVASYLISFLYKYSYSVAIVPFQILAVSACFDMMNSVYMGCLLACDRQKDFLISTFLAAMFNIILVLIIVPSSGVMGAAIALLLTEILLFILLTFRFKKVINLRLFEIITVPLISAFIMFLFILILEKIKIYNPIILILTGSVVYFSFLVLFLLVQKKYRKIYVVKK